MAKRRRAVRITVRLRSVPFDMMRYDRACPATETDSGKLDRLQHNRTHEELGGFADESEDDRTVQFLCYSEGAPTVARWKSFGCEILKTEDVL